MADRFSRGRLDRDRALQLVACHGARARRAADPACQSRGPPRRPGAAPPRGRESRRAGAARPAARAPPAVRFRGHPPAPPPGGPALMAEPALRLPPAGLRRALRRRYAYFAGPYGALDVQPLRTVRGVHLEPVLNRFYPASDLARPVIGRVGDDGRGASGLERALDSLLAGRPGAAVVLKDRAGREYESPARVIAQPVAGADVALTLDAELQEIAQRPLDRAVRRNIARVKFAARLAPAEQYAMLRDFGFGGFRGMEFPAEATGRLRPPAEWSGLSAGSLAMGYEVSVTPLQLAVAYAALANDGVLLSPTLIRDVRGPGGDVAYRHRPQPVRPGVRPQGAAALRTLLRGVVEGGTGAEAALVDCPVAAKTGTARRVVGGRYAPGQYTARS